MSCQSGMAGPSTHVRNPENKKNGIFSQSVSSVAQLCPALCSPMDCSTPGFPVLHHLPELAQTHIHLIGDAIQPSSPLPPPSSPAFNVSQHQGFFPMTWFFTSRDQSIGASASASVVPMNTQGWFLLGLTGLILLQSKRISRVFSNTRVEKHQFFSSQPLYGPTLTSIYDYWKSQSLDYKLLCQ